MIRHLRAIIWLRWRLLANALHGGRRRDKVEQISRAFALVVPLMVIALSTGSIVAVGLLGFLGGRAAAVALIDPDLVVLILRGALLGASILVLILSITSPAQSALARYTRLLLLPIPRRVLHLVEVIANLADPWLIFSGVGLLAFAAGLLAGGRPGAAAVAAATACVLLVLLASLAALVGFVVGSLLRSRRRGEMLTLVFVLGISLAGLAPAIFATSLENRPRRDRSGPARDNPRREFAVQEFERRLPAWSRVLPSEIGGRTLRHAIAGNAAAVAAGLAMLGAQAGLLFAGSAVAHRRMIDSLESDQSRRRSASARLAAIRVPLVSPAASAVAWAQMRTALRSVRGRVAVLLPGPMIALLSIVVRGQREAGIPGAIAEHGHLIVGAGMIFSLYAIQAFTMNLFGSDRAGLTLQFLSPLRDRDLAWGKVAGGGLIFGVAATFCLAAALAINPTGSPFYWVAMVLGGAATYLLLSPFAVWLSALFPVASDLSKTGSGGNPHPLPMLAGTILVLLFAAPAALIVVAADVWLDRPAIAPLLMAGWLAAAALLAIPGVRLAARAIGARRENLALTAQAR